MKKKKKKRKKKINVRAHCGWWQFSSSFFWTIFTFHVILSNVCWVFSLLPTWWCCRILKLNEISNRWATGWYLHPSSNRRKLFVCFIKYCLLKLNDMKRAGLFICLFFQISPSYFQNFFCRQISFVTFLYYLKPKWRKEARLTPTF